MRRSRCPSSVEKALDYLEDHRNYSQWAKEWYCTGPKYDHLPDVADLEAES